MKKIVFIFILCCSFISVTVFAQEVDSLPPMPEYECHYTSQRIVIDGKIDDEAWNKASRTERFVNLVTGERMPYETYVKMLWDNEWFYVAYFVEEEDIRGVLTGRDSFIWYDNDIEVFFDPDGDCRHYFEFEMNALNTVYDIHWNTVLWRDPDAFWDIGWNFDGIRHAVQYQGTLNWPKDKDKSWTAEIAFPLRSFLKYGNMPIPPKHGDCWRIDFYRAQYRDRTNKVNDHYSWSVHGKVNMHMPERFGFVRFVKE